MPAVVAIELNPKALILPFAEIKAGTEVLIAPPERSGLVDQGFPGCLQPEEVGARRDLLTEDLPFSNLGAVLEFGLEVKDEKGGSVPRPRREDFETDEDYAYAYGRWLIKEKGVDKQTASRSIRGIIDKWQWERGHPGDRE